MSIILFDPQHRKGLYPFTLTRAIADLRLGILTSKERWELLSGGSVEIHTCRELQPLYGSVTPGEHTWVDAAAVIDAQLAAAILSLRPGQCLADESGLLAGKAALDPAGFDAANSILGFQDTVQYTATKRLKHPWEIMQWNDELLRRDFQLLTGGRNSSPIPASVNVLNSDQLFIEAGAKLNFCTLNASTGPIYIGKDAEVMEGSVIRGPFALGEGSVLKLNSRVYGATTLGPMCMGGGEIKNVVMMGFSNKAHDGYLGDSVVGHWCNFGAGSTNSNVKNTAGMVKIWDMGADRYAEVGLKCGLVMGDYSRVAINSAVNTGSMIGVSANVFGAGLLPTIIGNFSWGVQGTRYDLQKALVAADNWKKLKGQTLTEAEAAVLKHIFAQNH